MKNHSGNRAALPVGTRLRQYRIDGVLGAGGFGVTYLAHDIGLQAQVAIKEFFPNQFAVRDGTEVQPKSPENEKDYSWGLKRFLEEAQGLARFQHPNIVRARQVFKSNNTAYIVLDYEKGRRFGTWLDDLERRPTEGELRPILMPLLSALEEVHGQKLLHRDIAPDNIIIRLDGSPVLLDFGAARQAIGAHSKSISAIIKPGYSPPEQYSTRGSQGAWTDIYALSATLYRAISGETPPDGSWRAMELLTSEIDPIQPLDRDGYLAAFIEAIEAGLSVNANNRPQTIAAWRKMFGEEELVVEEIKMSDWENITLEKARRIIVGGYNVNVKDDWTPLHTAAANNGNPEIIRVLLSAGADMSARSFFSGWTPLHSAAWKNTNPEILEILLSAGANVRANDNFGWIPLHQAAWGNENPEIIRMLLSVGADMNERSYDGGTSLHWAAENNKNLEVMEVLLAAGADMSAKNNKGQIPLHSAALGNNNPEIIRALLSMGADVSAKANNNAMPLHLAAYNENPEIIGVLLSAGADVNAKSDGGGTPLHLAAEKNGNPEIIRVLISAGADVNAKTDEEGGTPLHLAVLGYNSQEVITALVSAGADVNAKADNGWTPLHWAAGNKEIPGFVQALSPRIIEALLQAGADVNAKDDEGKTPLDMATERNKIAAIESIHNAGGKSGKEC